jgi:hypothetical protein
MKAPGLWKRNVAYTLSVFKVDAKESQCEEVEKLGQNNPQLPPSQTVGDDTERQLCWEQEGSSRAGSGEVGLGSGERELLIMAEGC